MFDIWAALDEATIVVLRFKLDELSIELLLLFELCLLAELAERFKLLLIELELLLFKLDELLIELLLTELELRFELLLELLLLVKLDELFLLLLELDELLELFLLVELDELLETCSTIPVAVAVIHA